MRNQKKHKNPPRLAQWLLGHILTDERWNTPLGDFEEFYNYFSQENGTIKAWFWYWGQVIKLLPKKISISIYWSSSMFKNYIKTAFRNIKKSKIYSVINISGLAIGIACAIFILLWVQDELSYDGFHENKDNIYRVVTRRVNEGNTFYGAQTSPPVAPNLKKNFPEVLKSTTFGSSWLTGNSRNIIKYGENSFYTDDLVLTDTSFFELFSFPFIKGDKKTALASPNNVVLTKSVAEKCFGDEEPLNKTIEIDGNPVLVTGVIEDIPNNSHLQFEVILPLIHVKNTKNGFFLTKWDSYGFATYVQLQAGVNIKEMDTKIEDVIRKNDPYFGDRAAYLFLQPLSKIRLFNVDRSVGFMQYVYIFSTIAVIILLIACINYMNLATARSEKRAKEIGLRKVVGSKKSQIIKQFYSESLLYALLSFFIAIFIVLLFLPQFNELTGKQINFNFLNPGLLFGLILVALFTGIISGSYPALYLSSIVPINILNKAKSSGSKKSLFRKILVVTQFSLSIGLIISMMIVSNQVGFMRNAEVGFEKENVVTFPISGEIETFFESFKHELTENPDILAVSLKSSSPLRVGGTSGTISWEGKKPDQQINWYHPMVEYDYFKTLNMKMVAGRDFSKEIQSDLQQGFILNEEAVRQGNIENPLGKNITVNGTSGVIIGVVKNAQLNSLRFTMRPEVYHMSRTFREQFQTLFIKCNSGEAGNRFNNVMATINFIEGVWKKFMPNAPFEYRFLDATIEDQYRAEMRISVILKYFTFLAVFLSCLGLFGLTSFMAEQRTKEIAVRKTLGAPVNKIVFLLMNQFLLLILIANIVAWPIAYFAMNNWLQDFANRVEIGVLTFAFSCLLSLVIAVMTVTYQSLKAALVNPVESLKHE